MLIRFSLPVGVLMVSCVAACRTCRRCPQRPRPVRSVYERYTEPIQVFKNGLGTFTRPMSSSNMEAQAFFDQGFQMMYSFAKPEAVRSFREAWKRDADCAICYWGEAWAWGSYLNAPMTADEAPHAYAAVRKALTLSQPCHATRSGRSSRRSRCDMSRRSTPRSGSNRTARMPRRCRKYRRQYPDDLDIATLYADALFLLEPRRGTRDHTDPDVQRLHQVLEGVLTRDVRHPGACHLYVHATESTTVPGRAEACAEFLGLFDPWRQPHQPHAVAHMERGGALGRFGACQSHRLALGPEGGDRAGLCDLSGAQSAHAPLRGVVRRPGCRLRCGRGRTTRSSPESRSTKC